jgi:hypothetical protein
MIHTTTKQKAAGAINANGLHTNTTGADFPTCPATEQAIQAPTNKTITTQIAQLALAGHAVHKGRCGDFTVCKYGMARYCHDFDELQAFSRKLGVTK